MSNNRIVYRQDGSQVPIKATNVEASPELSGRIKHVRNRINDFV